MRPPNPAQRTRKVNLCALNDPQELASSASATVPPLPPGADRSPSSPAASSASLVPATCFNRLADHCFAGRN
ncbi:hypothetical protein PtA15_15A232 [Puccinia triticina]|uniref:Uncharacterized protein n=1 Tax=Puccinia triticina TaxID=208348 RepID=A0ABY7D3M7_9BASI|nr:uncharacterized protein PtA15_15A232 [Puccinia triticina]WAQ91840.1 hypothetical protein PtA15_15A232 [Puccinia triticina]